MHSDTVLPANYTMPGIASLYCPAAVHHCLWLVLILPSHEG